MSEDISDPEEIAIVGLLNMTSGVIQSEDLSNFVVFASDGSSNQSSDEASSVVEDPNHLNESGRKRRYMAHNVKQNRSALIAICFPKGDLRNMYAESYFEAANSGNNYIITKTLTDMCAPDVSLVCRYDVPDNDYVPEDIEVKGVDAIAAVVGGIVKSTPDAILKILNKQVELHRNGESVIIVTWSMKGTMLYNLAGFEGGSKEKVVVTSSTTSDEKMTDNLNSLQINATTMSKSIDRQTGKPIDVQNNTKFGLGSKKENWVEVSWVATNTFYINKDRKVFLIVSEK